MIVKMKRLTLLCLTDDRDGALEELRELGVVHVTDRRPPAGDELDALRARLADDGAGARRASRVRRRRRRGCGRRTAADAGEVVAEVLALLDRRAELDERIAELCAASSRATRASGTSTWSRCAELERAGVEALLCVAPPRGASRGAGRHRAHRAGPRRQGAGSSS